MCEEIENISNINFYLLPALEEKFQKETLAELNLDKKKCLSSQKYRHILTSKLIITEHPYCVTNNSEKDITKIPYWISEWLRNRFINNHTKDNNFPSHKHFWKKNRQKKRIVQESWLVIKGLVKVTFFDVNDKVLTTTILKPGDLSVTFEGGHKIDILKNNTLIYEHKNGPYEGQKKDLLYLDKI